MRPWRRSVLLDVLDLTEDADHPGAPLERNGTHLDRDALAFARQDDGSIVRSLWRSQQVAGEDLAAAAPLLRSQDGRDLTSPNVADDSLSGRIDPADDSLAID